MSFMKPEEDLNEMVPSSIVSLTPETNPKERESVPHGIRYEMGRNYC